MMQIEMEKQDLAQQRVAEQNQEKEEAWKIYNEEQAMKQAERDKKIERNLMKLQLKKVKVVEKIQRHE